MGRILPHVTLVPPCNLPVAEIGPEIYRLRRLASLTTPFVFTVGPGETFAPRSPVLYLAIDARGSEQFSSLYQRIYAGSPYEPKTRPFIAHVTLIDGADNDRLEAGRKLLAAPLFSEESRSFEMLISPAQGHWEGFADFRFETVRKLYRGGALLEVFAHRGGDFAIYALAAGVGMPPSLFHPTDDRRLRHGDQEFICISVYCDGALAAAGMAAYAGTLSLIRAVAVAEGFQRRGIGSLVIEELLFRLRQSGVEMALALTSPSLNHFVHSCGAHLDQSVAGLVYENGMTLNSWSFSRR